ncbi:MAG: helix-hairpin-helix domain-containing protein [Planctomycetaceae bacterium]|jgi:comEA protein|nr:helix-hairpin-helix domain-containing protein [Planctomycetaceae bacterium]
MRFLLRDQDQRTVLVLLTLFFAVIFYFSVSQKEWKSEQKKEYRFLVDMNTAGTEELQALPGIGEKLAEGITTYREKNGPFNDHQEIMNVKGIGFKKLDTVKPYLLELPLVTSNVPVND